MTDIEKIIQYFIENFVADNKKDRMLQFLNKKKNWWKIINEFHTSYPFDKKVLQIIKASEQNSESIYYKLNNMGAEDECLSLLDYLNNKNYKYNLSEKLNDTVGYLIETILYCPKSKVGYFEGGHSKDRFILRKK